MRYSTGFGVNLGVVSTLTGREDYIIIDEQDHASIIEGRRLSFSNYLKYKHNDMASLEAQLRKCDPDKVKDVYKRQETDIPRHLASLALPVVKCVLVKFERE